MSRPCWGIIPAAGNGTRIQPLAFSKELLPMGGAIFRAAPLVHESEDVIVRLPDTIWFPEDAMARLPTDKLAFLLFRVTDPSKFDAVLTDAHDRVQQMRVKQPNAVTRWIWGAFRMPGHVFHALRAFWRARLSPNEYVGTLVNAWLAADGEAVGIEAGVSYVDVGTLPGYRATMRSLEPAAP